MSAWLPDAARVLAYRDAGPMGGAPRVLWIASGLDDGYSAALTARYANANVRCPHVVYDPRDGSLIQMLPADRRAMWVNSPGIQIVVCCKAQDGPFPLKGQTVEARSALARVMGWVRDFDVPDFRPLGPPVSTHPIAAGSSAGHYISKGRIMFDPEEPMPLEVDVPEGEEEEADDGNA